ncbi:hypothetical protein BTVI_136770 [Pitangus sulphuratus]|nr:hypothetical protein BTVI_136770 [Pitangus sulphuratus]
MRRGVMLELVLTNNEALVGNVKPMGSLGCSDHEMLRILKEVRRDTMLGFRTEDLGTLGICLIKYHGIKHWREEEPKKAG